MSKKTTIIIIIVLIALSFLVWPKIHSRINYQQRMALAQETHKAVNRLMFDLRDAQEASIQGVASDGQWHDSIVFQKSAEGRVSYSLKDNYLKRISNNGHTENVANHIEALRLRRLAQNPGIIEVQLEAKNKLSLTTNFKIRFRN